MPAATSNPSHVLSGPSEGVARNDGTNAVGSAPECGRIAFDAHQAVSAADNFPSEQPSVEFAVGMIDFKLKDPNAYGVVAERDGTIVGSVFVLTGFPGVVSGRVLGHSPPILRWKARSGGD